MGTRRGGVRDGSVELTNTMILDARDVLNLYLCIQ